MKTLTLLIIATTLLLSSANSDNRKDFITGFLMAMRMTEKVEHLFPCVMSVEPFKQAVAEAEALVNEGKSVKNFVEAGQIVLDALDETYPQCGAVAVELSEYLGEIKTIVSDPDYPHQLQRSMMHYPRTIEKDIKGYKQARADGDYLLAGMKLGDIGRIAIWGEPNDW